MKKPNRIDGLGRTGARNRQISGAGIGLRTRHIDQVLMERPPVPWFELLADNHLAAGGLIPAQIEALRESYPLTLHCIGMNLAGTDPLDLDYVARVGDLRDRCDAAWVSDHLCFTAVDGRHYHDLLPIPYTEESLALVAGRIHRVQERLREPLVVENVSSYLRFSGSRRDESEFLSELVSLTGCRLLLDINNLYVNQVNHGEDAKTAVEALPLESVAEIHLGGYQDMEGWLLDAHNNPVSPPVWQLYEWACRLLPDTPVLIEWDNDIPELAVLRDQAETARQILERTRYRSEPAETAAGGLA